ncbi:DNA glycosylase [Metarhizium album ARSEF 1941]|uniref:DNA glycosylase n=1 Tax=Metarhizium album (strain ARSEF 1941) TaxID=1081103 RepID=A0A0B2WUL5_METAS|nr:DNA glycosylase [Metarhizium album ARSEF 1941]KHN96650.1 DNA glycosylase [Metarhizium album ARSEF 1941]
MAATRRSSRLSAQPDARLRPPSQRNSPQLQNQTENSAQNTRKRKASTSKATPPVTPTRRPAKRIQPEPPYTPTPSTAVVIAAPAESTNRPTRAAVARLADPRATNAALLSPETSRVVASKDIGPGSPSKEPGATGITTENLLDVACAHLISVDERMRPLVERNHCRMFSPEGLAEKIDPFDSLASGIISQQVSGAAAKSIKARFVALFDTQDKTTTRFPHPSEVAAASVETLRTAGLSQRKAEYIKGLAEKFTNGDLSTEMLHEAPYEELVDKLIAVRGLGRWSVEMFACFGLKRMDVFSVGDLGVQRGMAAFVGRDVAKLKSKGGKWKYMSEKDMLEMSEKFAPYRSLFMWLMWRVEDSCTDVSTLE